MKSKTWLGAIVLSFLLFSGSWASSQVPAAPKNLRLVTSNNNLPPIAADDAYSTGKGQELSVPAPGVLANDSDPDGDSLTAQLVSGPSHGTLVLNADGSFNYIPAAGFTGQDLFNYIANDGRANSKVAAVGLRVDSTLTTWFSDSFEGMPLQGWNGLWTVMNAATGNHRTTDEGGTPLGGGNYAYRQSWLDGENVGGLLLGFNRVSGMPAVLNDDDDFYISYYVKYHRDFDFGLSTGLKEIILQGDSEINDRMYICIASISGEARTYVTFQATTDTSGMYSNVNGPAFVMPSGEWFRFDWYIKVSDQTQKQGVLKGWVNGILRWDYSNIATIKAGGYTSANINTTFNNRINGPSQRRYWDLIRFGPGAMVGQQQH